MKNVCSFFSRSIRLYIVIVVRLYRYGMFGILVLLCANQDEENYILLLLLLCEKKYVRLK